jgi:hypothetical protein
LSQRASFAGKEKFIHGLVCKPEGKRPLGRPRQRREGNIRKVLQETGWGN